MKKILVFGTFDLLHPGHLNFFRQAKKLGDYLIVVVGTDRNVTRIKGQTPSWNQQLRIKNLEKTSLVDKVQLAPEDYDYLALIKREKPNIIALGYDQKPTVRQLKQELKSVDLSITVARLRPFKQHLYKTSLLKKSAL